MPSKSQRSPAPPPSPTLPYAAGDLRLPHAELSRPGLPNFTVARATVVAVPAVVLIAAVHFVLGYLAPHMASVFTDFKMDLPAATRVLFAFSDAYRNAFGWIVFPAAVLLAAGLYVVLGDPYRPPSRWPRRVMVIVMGLIVVWTVLALFVPMVSLIQNMSSPAPKR